MYFDGSNLRRLFITSRPTASLCDTYKRHTAKGIEESLSKGKVTFPCADKTLHREARLDEEKEQVKSNIICLLIWVPSS